MTDGSLSSAAARPVLNSAPGTVPKATLAMNAMKRDFFILVDYGSGGTGYVVRAYSRQQIDEIFNLPKSNWIQVLEEGFEDHPIYKAQISNSGSPLSYDVDSPTGPLKVYMESSGILTPQQLI